MDTPPITTTVAGHHPDLVIYDDPLSGIPTPKSKIIALSYEVYEILMIAASNAVMPTERVTKLRDLPQYKALVANNTKRKQTQHTPKTYWKRSYDKPQQVY